MPPLPEYPQIPAGEAAAGDRGCVHASYTSLESKSHIASLPRFDEVATTDAERITRIFFVAGECHDDARPFECTHRLQRLEGIEDDHVSALHVFGTRPLGDRVLPLEALERAVFFEDRVQVSDQQQPLTTIAEPLGEQVTCAVHALRHRDPAGGESHCVQLRLEDASNLAHPLVVHRAAVDVHDALEERDRLFDVHIDVLDDLSLGGGE